MQKKILDELAENKKDQKVGPETFATPLKTEDIQPGRSLEEIIAAMKKASREKLLKVTDDVTFC